MKALTQLYQRVAEEVESRAAADPTADDPLRGLVIPASTARWFAARGRPAPGSGVELTSDDRLARQFGLSAVDEGILLIGLAPDVDRRFEPLYGYLNDDVSRRHASVALALELLGLGADDPAARDRFHATSPLVRGGLLEILDTDRPLPGRSLRVPERVVAHLLGSAVLDETLLGHARLLAPPPDASEPGPDASQLARLGALRTDTPLVVHVRAADQSYAVSAVHADERPALILDGGAGDLVPAAIREARLRDGGLVVGPLGRDAAPIVAQLARLGAGLPLFTFGVDGLDPAWAPDATVVTVEPPSVAPAPTEPALAPYRLNATQLDAVRATARLLAAVDDEPVTDAHLQRAARQQSTPLADRNVRRVPPAVGWPDLMLPETQFGQLRELVERARTRRQVLGGWRMRVGGGRGQGVTALFAGDSGTGKTLAAEVVAGELGLDLYVVDLSSMVDKYIGETEKNLERVFTAADQSDSVLLFDEADALFGKRGEVRDARDRYANLESAYLLQRLESFSGVAVLTTNLRANIDAAFTRRFDLIVDFPFPSVELRARLWELALTGAPQQSGLVPVLTELAAEFELAGGAIRSAAVTAAYLAAARGDVLTAADVRTGAEREYRKLGRLVPARN